MRPGQNKRMRGRPNNNGGGQRRGPNPLTRSYESNGPDVKIRGNAHHVAEKYLQLARDAQSSGDPVSAESYLQHAEHYFRLIASAQAAQAGFNRQPDAVDDVDDSDEDALPDRFASPQAPAPFVPQPQQQPYNGDRPAYAQGNGQAGERQPYADRQAQGQGQGGQPYAGGGERPQYGDRNGYNRQDRNGNGNGNGRQDRRPYRDNNGGGEIRAEDRGGERPYGDRPNRRERFNRENGGDRPYSERGFDRPREDRFREQPAPEQVRDLGAGDQPRVEASFERQPDYAAPEPAPQAAPAAYEAAPEPVERAAEPLLRAEAPAPRRRERSAPPAAEDGPGLPSFITAPPRAASPAEPAGDEPSLTTATPFPGDDAAEAPKFPRRRRRTTRGAAPEGDAPETPQPAAGD